MRKYFSKKFGAAESFAKILKSANPFFKGSGSISSKNFFYSGKTVIPKLAYPSIGTPEIKVVDVTDIGNPGIVKRRMKNLRGFRKNSKCVVLPTGDIFVTGGYIKENNLCSPEVYRVNLEDEKVEKRANMIVGRCSHAILVIDYNIYVLGGKRSDKTILDSFEVYNVTDDRWEALESCEYPVVRPLLVSFVNNLGEEFIYKIGGYGHSGKFDLNLRLLPSSGTIRTEEKNLENLRLHDQHGQGRIAQNRVLFLLEHVRAPNQPNNNFGKNILTSGVRRVH